jgi:hypothetical protein
VGHAPAAPTQLQAAGLAPGTSNRQIAALARRLSRQPTTHEHSVPVLLVGPPPPINASERATPENRQFAQVLDEMDKLDSTALERKRWAIVKDAVSYPSPEHTSALRMLEAIEFIEQRRGIKHAGATDWSSSGRRASMRTIVEEGIRENGSFEKTIESLEGHSDTEADLERFNAEAKSFASEFRGQAFTTAERMLDASQIAIRQIIESYGLPYDSAKVEASEYARDVISLDDAVNGVIEIAMQSNNVDLERNWKKRRDLADKTEELKKLQQLVHQREHERGVAWTKRGLDDTTKEAKEARAADQRLKDAYRQLKAGWIAAERLHPVLGSFRHAGDLDKVDLGELDTASVQDEMRAVLHELLPKLGDIGRARYKLQHNQLDPLTLPTVVAMTRANMFIPKGSIRDGVANDLQRHATSKSPWLTLFAFALAVITLIPSAGASLAIPAGIGAVALATYQAVEEWEDYSQKKLLSNTAVDIANALVTEDPSLRGFVESLFSIGLEMVPLALAFREARALKRLMAAGEDGSELIAKLNRLGEEKGLGKLGDQIADDARKTAKAKPPEPHVSKPSEPHGGGPHEPHGGGPREPHDPHATTAHEPRKPTPHGDLTAEELAKVKSYSSADAVKDATKKAFEKLGNKATGVNPEYDVLQTVIGSIKRDDNGKRLLGIYKQYHATVRDPEAAAEFCAAIWKRAADKHITTLEALEELVPGGRTPHIVNGELTKVDLLEDSPFIDMAFNGGDHGTHTHLFMEGLIDFKHGAGKGREIRHMIARSEGRGIPRGPGQPDKEFYGVFWDAMFDEYDRGHLNSPEGLQAVLEEHLGFPRRIKPR